MHCGHFTPELTLQPMSVRARGPNLAAVSLRHLSATTTRPLLLASPPPCRPSALRSSEASTSSADDLGKTAEETTRKYGLEAGLWNVFTAKNADGKSKGDQAKELLKRYGSAYLLTSISFAVVSFAACYAMVTAGVDVAALLARVGLQATDTSEKVGTFAIAYAAHKALSPVRFPPTVALTPVVARWLGKDNGDVAATESVDGKE